jgi:hypothetical protein
MIRWFIDRAKRAQLKGTTLDEDQLTAESDKSPGVLLASGYIAGGAIAGILIAILAGVFDRVDHALHTWSLANNPFYAGEMADLLALLPFVLIAAFLFFVGREKLLRSGK